jgi:hypothetical protein
VPPLDSVLSESLKRLRLLALLHLLRDTRLLEIFMPRTVLLILLIVLLLALMPTWPYSSGWGWGWYPSGGLGLILIIVVLVVLLGGNKAP